MKRVKHAIAIGLFSFSLSIGGLGSLKLRNPEEPPTERYEAAIALIFFGLLPLAGSIYLGWDIHRGQQQAKRDRLHQSFVQLLQTGAGNISVLDFVLHAQLPRREAQAYLDERACEFDATFEVDDEGRIFYHFAVSPGTLHPRVIDRLKECDNPVEPPGNKA